MSEKPALRPLDFQPIIHQGQQMWFLRDPLQLTDYQLVIPAPLAQMLIFCDGTHTPQEIHEAFCRQIGQEVEYEIIADALERLDLACLLDNARSRQARQALLDQYRTQPHRPPALAGLSYPGEKEALTDLFGRYGSGDDLNGWQPWRGRGIISPHIDYQRGGPVYAKVWRRAEAAVAEADLVLMFGTDHNGSAGSFTLTRQPYASPYGVIPTDLALIDKVAEAVGPQVAFAEELHHRSEHSVELSAVWLHYTAQQAGTPPPPMVPILCGSFQHFVMNGAHPADDVRLTAAIETLKEETTGKKVLAVASVDLAHVGPTFGDGFLMDESRRFELAQKDGRLIEAILQGDAADFYQQIAAVGDRNRICGFSSIYLMLRYLESVERGIQVDYDHCPADSENNSLVSICGLLLN